MTQEFLNRARAAYQKKDFAQSEQLCRQLIASGELNEAELALARFMLSDLYIDQNMYEQAIAVLSDIIEGDARSEIALCNRAYCFRLLGRKELAIKDYSSASEVSGMNAAPVIRLVELLLEADRVNDAYDVLSAAVKKKLLHVDILTLLGEVQVRLSNHVSAYKCFQKALRMDPTSKIAKRYVAKLELEANSPSE